jgi:hypothetical protein
MIPTRPKLDNPGQKNPYHLQQVKMGLVSSLKKDRHEKTQNINQVAQLSCKTLTSK